ncbi:FkbM family methyltransferase [Baekduia soli]|uniref:FkbM family methyltransferase n=1 Tax=Baekduia soli TaxID=496014 RepID=A0A5B8TZU4_9ACTN|nr:FkbM family methyltransferase [Baekduia soli]QEC46257.1 FkbM family methyltransferase [Baekduia soli]
MSQQGLSPALRMAVPVVRLLKLTGQRERVLAWRAGRARRARLAAGRDDPRSHPALHGMDRRLDAILDRDGGFFVEAGANDGYRQSNTYWLERFRGWRGILVEPMQELYDLCRLERPSATVVRAALVPAGHEGDTVPMQFAGLMSTVSGEHVDPERTEMGNVLGWYDPYEADVPARTLSSVLDAAGAPEVDLLSLDVEGYEPGVLAGLDLERHAPRWILVEVHDEATGRPPIEAVLGDRYVLFERLSPVDLLYRRADVAA